jgi:hypothetical protein
MTKGTAGGGRMMKCAAETRRTGPSRADATQVALGVQGAEPEAATHCADATP